MADIRRNPSRWAGFASRRVGRLVSTTPDGITVGTATLLSTEGTFGIISTAAHCLTTGEHDHVDSRVLLGRRHGIPTRRPSGRHLEVLRAFVPTAWRERASVEHDLAFAVVRLPREFDAEVLGPEVRPDFSKDIDEGPVAVVGFESRVFPRRAVIRNIASVDRPFADATAYRARCGISSGGSGGPWLVRRGGSIHQFSVTSFGSRRDRRVLFGPTWDAEAAELHAAASQAAAQAAHLADRGPPDLPLGS